MQVLGGLIEQVLIKPADKGFETEIVGEIAKMVELGTVAIICSGTLGSCSKRQLFAL